MIAHLRCLGVLLTGILAGQVVDTTRSPYARLHPVPVRAVRIQEGFWSPRIRVNIERSIPTMLQLLEEHGVVDNFRRVSGRKKADRRGPLYTDSDLYKWIEAAAFVLQTRDDAQLRATVDRMVDEVAAAQEPSGYLNTYWVDERAARRFQEQTRGHELYCLGHMLQAGIAYHRAGGSRKLLDTGIRFANFMVENFGPSKRPALTGHPELEMALVELYRTTGDKRYLDFAGYLLSGVERQRLGLRDTDIRYMFSGVPFTSRTKFEGHAVRAMYASSGATDYYLETGDEAYRRTLETLWRDMTSSKMYITGGVGSRSQGEAFGEAYELPNAQAYTESCAAIGNMMWNWRMLAATGEARFADVMERALYNGINSGMSLDGTLYCYRNPLASSSEKIRNPWYDTTCCPPNIERTLASLGGYMYSTSSRGVYVHLYHASRLDWKLEDGTPIEVLQETNYPWDGAAGIQVSPARRAEFSVFVRIPAWSRETKVNGSAVPHGEYFELRRVWQKGDKIRIDFDMAPRMIQANPLVRENGGKVSVARGPLVYCLEQADHAAPIRDLSVTAAGEFKIEKRAALLGGVTVLRHNGIAAASPLAEEPLYRVLAPPGAGKAVELTFVPYYAWANRGPGQMEVWIPYR